MLEETKEVKKEYYQVLDKASAKGYRDATVGRVKYMTFHSFKWSYTTLTSFPGRPGFPGIPARPFSPLSPGSPGSP